MSAVIQEQASEVHAGGKPYMCLCTSHAEDDWPLSPFFILQDSRL